MNEPGHTTGSISVSGVTLRYRIEGNGIPALVLGSAIYYPRTFSQPLRDLLQMAFVDVRHFAPGSASNVERTTTADYLDDIDKLRAAAGFGRVILIGHSHHGTLALEYAKRYPEAVSHLVLIGAPPADVEMTMRAGNAYWAEHASDARKDLLRENNLELTQRLALLSPEAAYVAQYVADGPKYWFDEHYDASWLWDGVPINLPMITRFRNFFAGYQLSWDPSRMRAPILVITGRHDYVVPPVLWTTIAPRLPQVACHVFERSGHTPQLEEPELFDRVLLDWLATAVTV